MLVFRNYREKDKNILDEYFKNLNIEFDVGGGHVFLAFSDDDLIGASKVSQRDGKWYYDFIYIDEKERGQGLGKGLFRSMLNKINVQGVSKIYLNNNSNFLIKQGFYYNKTNELELDIDKFFSTSSCGSCGG